MIRLLTIFFTAFFFACVFIRFYLASVDQGVEIWNHWFTGETGILDAAEAVMWVPVIAINILSLKLLDDDRFSYVWLWHGALALACMVFLGEEISWGQHLFGWTTPSELAVVNVQNETNFHNLNFAMLLGVSEDSRFYWILSHGNHFINPLYYLFAICVWIVMPIVLRKTRILPKIPVIDSGVSLYLFIGAIVYLVVDKLFYNVGELWEFCITSTFLLGSLDMYLKHKSQTAVASTGMPKRLLN